MAVVKKSKEEVLRNLRRAARLSGQTKEGAILAVMFSMLEVFLDIRDIMDERLSSIEVSCEK